MASSITIQSSLNNVYVLSLRLFELQEFDWSLIRHSEFLTKTCPAPGHVQQLTTLAANLDAFSYVVECIFFLQQDNVICQALLDLWGESGNPCTIYALLLVPLDTLTITYGRTSNAQPLNNAYKNWITQF
jgi:hypothetical protein